MNVDDESQRNCHNEDAVGLEDDGCPIAICHKPFAGELYRVEGENGGGLLNAPPPPDRLEHHPAQPEFTHGGQMLRSLNLRDFPVWEAGWGLRNELEDRRNQPKC